jgi:hypothetical protein
MASFSSASANEIRDSLVSASYWDKDWNWAFQQLRNFAEHGDDQVLWAVALGVGFIAAFNGEIDEHAAQSILTQLKTNANSAVAAAAEEAELDIEHFVHRRQCGEHIELVERRPEDLLFVPAECVATGQIHRPAPWTNRPQSRTMGYPRGMLQAS